MITFVLATDMSKHFTEMGKFKTRISSPDFDPSDGVDKELTLTNVFHLSDISNPTKPWMLCQTWTDLLFVEFFN